MSERNLAPAQHADPGPVASAPAMPPRQGAGWKLRLVLKVLLARLRFLAVLAAVGAVIYYWATLNAYYEKWQRTLHVSYLRWTGAPETKPEEAGSDVEYFCPMHPQIVRDKPGESCPLCFMPLAKRPKGPAANVALPAGVVSRLQFSPYQVLVTGVRTYEVGYQPLSKPIQTVGFVEWDERRLRRISWRVPGRSSRIDRLYVNITDQKVRRGDPLASVYSPELVTAVQNLLLAHRAGNRELVEDNRQKLRLWAIDDDQIDEILRRGEPVTHITVRSPITGHVTRIYQHEGDYLEEGARLYDVADVSRVWIEAQVYEDQLAFLKAGLAVRATTLAFPGHEYSGRLNFIHPHLDQATRTLRVRFDVENPEHELRPGMYATVRIDVPASRLEVLAARSATQAHALFRDARALAVPESAVIDTGTRKVVYRESAPRVYDGVEVELGPRLAGPGDTAFYPVLRGLEAGDRVVTAGSFLIDAETRLNPAAGSIYYGGSGGESVAAAAPTRPTASADLEAEIQQTLAGLSPDDRRLALAQRFCPVQHGNRLGAMGPPAKVLIEGQPVFLCCSGCRARAQARPEQTLATVKELKAKAHSP